MEIEKASAIQNPSKLGHPHVRCGESSGTGSRSLFDMRLPSVPYWSPSERSSSRRRSPMLCGYLGPPGWLVCVLGERLHEKVNEYDDKTYRRFYYESKVGLYFILDV